MSQPKLKSLSQETLDILQRGYYEINRVRYSVPKPETFVYLQKDVAKKFEKYLEHEYISLDNRFVRTYTPESNGREGRIDVVPMTTLEAAHKIRMKSPDRIAILNFASAHAPGGGFLNGAKAQEESIARASSLYSSLIEGSDYYQLNARAKTMYKQMGMADLYTHSIIYSQNVTVIRSEDQLIPPHIIDVITCPAINRRVVRESESIINEIMKERAHRILCVAVKHQVKHLILGAWGCGVFQNDPRQVATIFADLIHTYFQGSFSDIIFAIPDTATLQCFTEIV